MFSLDLLKFYSKLHITRGNDVLNLELLESNIEPQFLDDSRILSGGLPASGFIFGTGTDHPSRGENQGSGFGITDSDDNSGKTLERYLVYRKL